VVNRKKRLKKGVDSIEEQIDIHEKKKEAARKEGRIELEDYYGRELRKLRGVRDYKKKLLDR